MQESLVIFPPSGIARFRAWNSVIYILNEKKKTPSAVRVFETTRGTLGKATKNSGTETAGVTLFYIFCWRGVSWSQNEAVCFSDLIEAVNNFGIVAGCIFTFANLGIEFLIVTFSCSMILSTVKVSQKSFKRCPAFSWCESEIVSNKC